jgi:hypothetical protein
LRLLRSRCERLRKREKARDRDEMAKKKRFPHGAKDIRNVAVCSGAWQR